MNTALLRPLIIYAIVLPLAVFIGWTAVDLANWDRTSFAVFAAIIFLLLLPALLKWHYMAMVLSWNTAITIFFLPGRPALWMLMAGINFGIAILQRIMQKRPAFISAPSITISLLAVLVVVVITGKLRGGFGVQAFGGSTYGGKAYFYIIGAIIGYFALASQSIPVSRAKLYMGLYFLPGLTGAISTLIYYAGPSFYFLYLVFPVEFAGVQAMSEFSGPIVRVAGFSVAACAVSFYLMTVHGIRRMLVKPWLLVLFVVVLALGALGGYRSFLLLVGVIFVILFITEGLLRSPIFPATLLIGGVVFAALVPLAPKLPLSVQRSLSFLPVKLDSSVRYDSASSIEWRLEIWRALVPDLPKYIWIGKGYSLNPTDIYLGQQAALRGRATAHHAALIVGDYHSGPLSTYVPLGGLGSLAAFVFFGVALRAVYLNYRYGDEALRVINRGIFAFFLGHLIFFVFAFGGFGGDLFKYTGTLGLSIALNNGICRKPVPLRQPIRSRPDLDLGTAQSGAV